MQRQVHGLWNWRFGRGGGLLTWNDRSFLRVAQRVEATLGIWYVQSAIGRRTMSKTTLQSTGRSSGTLGEDRPDSLEIALFRTRSNIRTRLAHDHLAPGGRFSSERSLEIRTILFLSGSAYSALIVLKKNLIL